MEATATAQTAPETITARALLGAVVILLIAALLVPTVRGALDQQQQLASLRDELAAVTLESERLDHELARWEDPTFIEAEARSRFQYVRPGDKVWRTVGGDILKEDVDPATGMRVKDGVVGVTGGQPWYDNLMESIKVAGGPVPEAPIDLTDVLRPGR